VSPWARVALALVLVAGAGLFVAAIVWPEPAADEPTAPSQDLAITAAVERGAVQLVFSTPVDVLDPQIRYRDNLVSREAATRSTTSHPLSRCQ
jgi:hypothetical protein